MFLSISGVVWYKCVCHSIHDTKSFYIVKRKFSGNYWYWKILSPKKYNRLGIKHLLISTQRKKIREIFICKKKVCLHINYYFLKYEILAVKCKNIVIFTVHTNNKNTNIHILHFVVCHTLCQYNIYRKKNRIDHKTAPCQHYTNKIYIKVKNILCA